MHVDVKIKLYRHVDMEKTCRPQHYAPQPKDDDDDDDCVG